MNWDDLRCLLALRRAGSLTRAAAVLRVDKATVSRRLAALAAAMGVSLVEHLPRGVRLTVAGGIAADAAERVDVEVGALLHEIGQGGAAPVRITLPVWFAKAIAMPALPRFRKRHPDVELRFLTTSDVLDLPGRRADVALRNVRPSQTGLVVRRAGTLGSALYGASSYLRDRGRPKRRADLAGHHLIAYESQVTYVPDLAWLNRAKVPVSFRASDALSLLDATTGALGLAVLPCFLGDSEATLVRLDEFAIGREEIWLVTHADLKRSPSIRAAMGWLADLFEAHASRLNGEIAAPGPGEAGKPVPVTGPPARARGVRDDSRRPPAPGGRSPAPISTAFRDSEPSQCPPDENIFPAVPGASYAG
jgi:DNA-binding transcriptional LysR family regulator